MIYIHIYKYICIYINDYNDNDNNNDVHDNSKLFILAKLLIIMIYYINLKITNIIKNTFI